MKKECRKYYFSVEGQTEKWYLEWLQKQINSCEKASYNVDFAPMVEKNPKKMVKKIPILSSMKIAHIFDFEEVGNETSFQETLSFMKEASKLKKNVKYILGYCNYTFDLWIILHKKCLMSSKSYRSDYLSEINKCYGQSFESMPEYKNEDNFKKILSSLSLDDVLIAIKNAEKICNHNEKINNKIQYSGYEYFRENPSLNLHEYIKEILKDVGLWQKNK